MKTKFFFLFIFISIFANAQYSLETLRKGYYNVNTDSAACKKLFDIVKTGTPEDNLRKGYKGAITAAWANFAKRKEDKIKLFNAGKKLMEESIAADSSNIELRFLRFTIQTNCPKALGYNKKINADKKFIVSHFDSVKSSDFKTKMSEYLLNCNLLTAEEKKKIKNAAQ